MQELEAAKYTVFHNDTLTSIFSIHPLVLSSIFFTYGLLLLLGCNKNLRSIVLKEKRCAINVGYWYSFNWSITHLVIVPAMAFTIAYFLNRLPLAVGALVDIGILKSVNPLMSPDQVKMAFLEKLQVSEGFVLVSLLIGNTIINVYDFFSYFIKRDKHGFTKVKDWTVLYQGWHDKRVSKTNNVMFNIAAYVLQWSAIFIGLLFIYKALTFLGLLYYSFGGLGKDFRVVLDLSDPSGTFGLWPLEALVDAYIHFVLLIVLYLVTLRFVHVSRKVTWEYAPRLVVVAGFLLIVFLFVIPATVINHRVENVVRENKVGWTSQMKKAALSDTMEAPQELQFAKAALVDTCEHKITLINRQSILPLPAHKLYMYIAFLLILFRLVLRPPDSLVHLLSGLLGGQKLDR